jgi:membrane-anchored glycerophosphoryl diester phosphodiesterase (GDPDase)
MSSWSKKRRLYLLDWLVLDAFIVVAIVLLLNNSGIAESALVSLAMLVVIWIHLFLRLTYFKGIRSEVLEQRRDRESRHKGPSSKRRT